MKSFFEKAYLQSIVFLLLAGLSFFLIAPKVSQPDFYPHSIEALQEKKENVLALTAVSAAASTAISFLPGDDATPIANEIADLSSYFLIVLCAIFLEKYLLTIAASTAFHVLFPIAFISLAVKNFLDYPVLKEIARKLIIFGLAIFLIVPVSVCISDKIEATYNASIDATIEDAKNAMDDVADLQDETNTEESSGLSGLFSKVTGAISNAATGTVEKFKNVLNNLIEALAIMIVTSCLIPILVIIFFLWLIKLVTGITVSLPSRDTVAKINPLVHHKKPE